MFINLRHLSTLAPKKLQFETGNKRITDLWNVPEGLVWPGQMRLIMVSPFRRWETSELLSISGCKLYMSSLKETSW